MHTQQKSLHILFLGEFLEKFSFWGLQSLLVLYLTKNMIISGDKAYTIFGIFTACTFVLSILSGFLADKFLGFRHALILGVMFIILGNVLLSAKELNAIYAGLAVIAFGTALFTTNNANLLGTFYDEKDPRRNKGFVMLYMATNIGGLLGPIIYGIISVAYDWHYCFLVTSVALSTWVLLIFAFRREFSAKGTFQQTVKYTRSAFFLPYLLILFTIIFMFFLLQFMQYAAILLSIVGISTLIFYGLTIFYQPSNQKYIILVLLAMISFSLIFFAIEFQVNSSLLLFIEQHVNRNIFDLNIPTNIFASIEPFFVIILGPFFIFMWKVFGKEQPSPFLKISIGLMLGGASFIVFSFAAYFAAVNVGKISISWILIASLLLGAGEICLMPTIVASITQLAPNRLKGTLMGTLYLSLGFSGYLAGTIATLTTKNVSTHGTFLVSQYTKVYSNVAGIAFIAAIVSLMFYIFPRYFLNKP